MKSTRFIAILFLLSTILFSCEKIKDLFEKENDKIEDNGLSVDINNIVPDSVLNTMKELGLPVNTGGNPPNIEKIYEATPFILIQSNVSSDSPGMTFADYRVEFFDQDNDELTIKFNYVSSYESGTGIGSYIVGDGKDFTVFAKVTSQASGTTAYVLNVISGTVVNDGIENFYYANWMLDNQGNTSVWIANNTGRVIYDSDGFSDEIENLKTSAIQNLLPVSAPK